MKRIFKRLDAWKWKRDDGFSLLELVVAVGILLILTVGGLLAYTGIQKQARIAAVQSAASEVLTGAAAHQLDNKSTTNAVDAQIEWNKTSKKDKADKAQITVKVEEAPTCLKVTATHVKGEQAIRQTGTGCVGDENGENESGGNTNPEDENGNGIPDDEENGSTPGGENDMLLKAPTLTMEVCTYTKYNVHDVQLSVVSGEPNTFPVGTEIQIPTWVTEGIELDGVEENGTSGGISSYLITNEKFFKIFSYFMPETRPEYETAKISMIAPDGYKFANGSGWSHEFVLDWESCEQMNYGPEDELPGGDEENEEDTTPPVEEAVCEYTPEEARTKSQALFDAYIPVAAQAARDKSYVWDETTTEDWVGIVDIDSLGNGVEGDRYEDNCFVRVEMLMTNTTDGATYAYSEDTTRYSFTFRVKVDSADTAESSRNASQTHGTINVKDKYIATWENWLKNNPASPDDFVSRGNFALPN